SFDLHALAAVSPVENSTEAVTALLERIAATGLVVRRNERAATLLFAHALVQEVAYDLLPYAQRRVLHRAVAEYIERTDDAAAPPVLPLVGHHWERADVPGKATVYLERAAEHALLNTSANSEAEAFLERLFAVARAHTRSQPSDGGWAPSDETRARW